MYLFPLFLLISVFGYHLEVKRPAGINNYGNFCFMASSLQALFSLPELRQAILDYDLNRLPAGSAQRQVMERVRPALLKWLAAAHWNGGEMQVHLKAEFDDLLKQGFRVATTASGGLAGEDAIMPSNQLISYLPDELRNQFAMLAQSNRNYAPMHMTSLEIIPSLDERGAFLGYEVPYDPVIQLGREGNTEQMVRRAFATGRIKNAPANLMVTLSRRLGHLKFDRSLPITIDMHVDNPDPRTKTQRPTIHYTLMGIVTHRGGFHYTGYSRICHPQVQRCDLFHTNDETVKYLNDQEAERALQEDAAKNWMILQYVDVATQRNELLDRVVRPKAEFEAIGQQLVRDEAAHQQRISRVRTRGAAHHTGLEGINQRLAELQPLLLKPGTSARQLNQYQEEVTMLLAQRDELERQAQAASAVKPVLQDDGVVPMDIDDPPTLSRQVQHMNLNEQAKRQQPISQQLQQMQLGQKQQASLQAQARTQELTRQQQAYAQEQARAQELLRQQQAYAQEQARAQELTRQQQAYAQEQARTQELLRQQQARAQEQARAQAQQPMSSFPKDELANLFGHGTGANRNRRGRRH